MKRGDPPLCFISIRNFGSLRLCLVLGKYKGKKKNAKENDFLMFGCPIEKYQRKSNIIKIN